MQHRMFDLINKKATTTRALLFVFILHLNTSFAQDTLSNNLTLTQDSLQATAPLFIQDTISEWKEPEDTLIIADDFFSVSKRNHALKNKKAFKFLSYFNYNDRGYGKDFSGVEKYEQFTGKKLPVSMSSFLNHLAAHRKVVLLQ